MIHCIFTGDGRLVMFAPHLTPLLCMTPKMTCQASCGLSWLVTEVTDEQCTCHNLDGFTPLCLIPVHHHMPFQSGACFAYLVPQHASCDTLCLRNTKGNFFFVWLHTIHPASLSLTEITCPALDTLVESMVIIHSKSPLPTSVCVPDDILWRVDNCLLFALSIQFYLRSSSPNCWYWTPTFLGCSWCSPCIFSLVCAEDAFQYSAHHKTVYFSSFELCDLSITFGTMLQKTFCIGSWLWLGHQYQFCFPIWRSTCLSGISAEDTQVFLYLCWVVSRFWRCIEELSECKLYTHIPWYSW